MSRLEGKSYTRQLQWGLNQAQIYRHTTVWCKNTDDFPKYLIFAVHRVFSFVYLNSIAEF